MKLLFSILIVLITLNTGYAQSEKYNIPPGNKIKLKQDLNIDYSEKLDQLPVSVDRNFVEPDFFKDFNKVELLETEIESPQHKLYYDEARNFYSSLSPRIKYTFTTDELWYIYQFDQALKNQLLKIK